MTDDLDEIKRVLAASPPPAPDGARKGADLAAALAAFDDAFAADAAQANAGADAGAQTADANAASAGADAAEGAVETSTRASAEESAHAIAASGIVAGTATGAASGDATAVSEKNSESRQGTTDVSRQKVRQSGLMTFIRRRLMNFTLPSMKTMMMGSASMAVFVVAVVATQDQWKPGLDELTGHSSAPSESDLMGLQSAGGGSNRVAPRDEETRAQRAEPAEPEPKPTPQPKPSPVIRLHSGTGSGQSQSAAQSLSPDSQRSKSLLDKGLVRKGPSALKQERPRRAQPHAMWQNGQGQSTAGTSVPSLADRVAAPPPQPAAEAPALAPSPAVSPGIGVQNAPIAAGDVDVVAQKPRAEEQGRDKFEEIEPNQIKVTKEEPVSTFSVDVDTASYAFMRQALNRRVLPQKNAIRIEELVNYFPYDYPVPESKDVPFSANVAVMDTPWNDDTKLMRIGIKGYELTETEKPRSNLVFLLDTSGSMNQPNKLPLLIDSFSLLVESLDPDDTVSIVVYAGSAGTVLAPTKVKDKTKILGALERLSAGGSTAGGEGIRQAYKLAEANFDKDGINRVILATDGDFNVGIRNHEELKGFVERKRETGIFLSVLGFGRGNYNDQMMQTLAQNGNGNAAYIDTISEAQKVLVDEASSTLFPIAKDVKIQVEFNPSTVGEYRLIGFETRILNREDFNNDKVDAGDIGAGHTVTALYEITPVDSPALQIDELRYETTQQGTPEAGSGTASEYAFVKIRYKQPDQDKSELITQPVTAANEITGDTEANFAAAVAAFGQLLRGGRYTGDFTYEDVLKLAASGRGEDLYNYRGEFISLIRQAMTANALRRQ